MMKGFRRTLSGVLYALSLLVTLAGTATIVYMHMGVWMRGHFVFGSIGAMIVVEYVIVSAVLWGAARLLAKRTKWDRAFYIGTAVPFLMMMVLPGRFYLGDL